MRSFLIFLFSLLLMPTAASARTEAKGQHYTVSLVAKQTMAQPGSALTYALVLQPDKGWHIYWSNPGQTGYAPGLSWTLPNGFKAGEVRHPAPEKLVLGGYSSNVHAGETILLQDIALAKTVQSGTFHSLRLALDLLVCSDTSCVPDPLTLDTSIGVGDGTADQGAAPLFRNAEAKMPQAALAPASMAPDGSGIRFFFPAIHLNAGDKATLFSEKTDALSENDAGKPALEAEGLSMIVGRGNGAVNQSLHVLLRIDRANGATEAYRYTASTTTPHSARFDWAAFLLALGAAILGGLVLNLMPCVFPMISLKAMSLVRAGTDEREARIEAIGYAIGAIGTIAAMGAALLILRAGGSTLGWAFQLQDPRVVAALLLLVVAIAINMAGLFELPSVSISGGAASSGYWGSISTGALAAFIATPCTGPFMAGALGAAMILPVPAAMAVFIGLGLGLALPFLGLGFIKSLRRWVPRPGPWMATFRHLLSLPMFATALGLAWILGRQVGIDGLMQTLTASTALGLALWWYGQRQRAGKQGHIAILSAGFAVMGALLLVPAANPARAAQTSTNATDTLHSEAFSEARLTALQSAKRPVFLYLTADWCLTCKVNEATSLANQRVAKSFAEHHVAVLRGDWTRQDPAISRFLKKHGRAGVPLYLWYNEAGQVEELPQILTPDMLLKRSRLIG